MRKILSLALLLILVCTTSSVAQVISVTPTTLNFGITSTTETLSISNTGFIPAILTWEITTQEPWISSISPSSGSIFSIFSTDVVTVRINRSEIPNSGQFSGRLTVNSNSSNEPLHIAVIGEVENQPPRVIKTIDDIFVQLADIPPDTITVSDDLNTFFTDDGDTLFFRVLSSDSTIAIASIIDNRALEVVVLTNSKDDSATISVGAQDNSGRAAVTQFLVKVNSPPEFTDPSLTPIVISIDALRPDNSPPDISDLDTLFTDPDNDPLTYIAVSDSGSIAIADTAGSQLIVTAVSAGETQISITALDGRGGRDTTGTRDVIINAQPDHVFFMSDPILLNVGSTNTTDLDQIFFDTDGDPLIYSLPEDFESSILNAIIVGNQLIVEAIAEDTLAAFITVIATDPWAATSSTSLEFRVGTSPEIALIEPGTNSNPLEDNTLTIATKVTDDSPLQPVRLFFRVGGQQGQFEVVMEPVSESNFTYTILPVLVTSRGLEFRIEAVDIRGFKRNFPESGFRSVQIHSPNGLVQDNPLPPASYRLFSVPLDLDNRDPLAIFRDELGHYDPTKWRLFELRSDYLQVEGPAVELYKEGIEVSEMVAGKAFMLISKEGGHRIGTGPGKSNRTDTEWSIDLHKGWNFIGNPFNFPIPNTSNNIYFQRDSTTDVFLRKFEGFWPPVGDAVSEIRPFEGYAVWSDSVGNKVVIKPDLSNTENPFTSKAPALVNESSWAIQILAHCRQARDVDNLAAVASRASENWDELDLPEPPIIGEYVSVYFPHAEWQKLSKKFCTDFRPESSDNHIWMFEVKTNMRDEVKLAFAGIENVPADFDVWLIDEVLQISRNLRDQSYYSVAGRGPDNPKRLKLVVGRHDFLAEHLKGLQSIPTSYELSQNFPNPFNPSTTIRYGLPTDDRVTLKIYNMLGKEVVTLLDNEEQPAGFHAVVWSGRNHAQRQVASGIYIYRIRTDKFSKVRKMILVK